MPNEFTTPGVPIEELPPGPRVITSPATDVAAFVGYTAHAGIPPDGPLHLTPVRIHSYIEFEQHFGVPFTGGSPIPEYLLGWAVRLFFENGGRTCSVVSVGTHGEPRSAAALVSGVACLAAEPDVTLLAVPDAATLPEFTDYQAVVDAVLEQCGTLRNRLALLDVWNGQLAPDALVNTGPADGTPLLRTVVEATRSAVTQSHAFGGAFYPFVEVAAGGGVLHLPPSGAVAGTFAASDAARGVWKAPTGIALAGVIRPVVSLSDVQQEPLNLDVAKGKSINVIRAFPGRGTVIWGARTLLGNDAEVKYIPVRRLLMMIETAVQRGTRWATFEPNAEPLWTALRASVENYLTQLWRDGALSGTRPQEAFSVRCGLGQTMTGEDVSEGRVVLLMQLAVTRPAEFLLVRVTHTTAAP